MADQLIDYEGIETLEYRTTLKSNPKAEVWGPGYKDWFMSRNVGKRTFDVVEMVDAILKAYLLHPDGGWNLSLPRTEHTIDTKLKPEDLDALSAELAVKFYPEIFKPMPQVTDPNEETPGTEETPPTATSTPKKSSGTRSSSR